MGTWRNVAAVMRLKIHLQALGENTSVGNPERQALRLTTLLKLHPLVAALSSSQLAKRSAQAGTHQTSATCITSCTGSNILPRAARSPKQPRFAAPTFQIKPWGRLSLPWLNSQVPDVNTVGTFAPYHEAKLSGKDSKDTQHR